MYEPGDLKEIDWRRSRREFRLHLKRSWLDFGEDAVALLLPLALLGIPMAAYIGIGPADLSIPVLAISAGSGFVLLGFIVRGIRANYRLESLELSRSKNEVALSMERLGWRVLLKNRNLVTAVTPISGFTWGQVITVILDGEQLFLNSNNRSFMGMRSPFAFGLHRKHLSLLKDELRKNQGESSDASQSLPQSIPWYRSYEALAPVLGPLLFLILVLYFLARAT